ncbi:hypothetical protein T4B_6192 [Trichinella pseudospiralis]|uniref:Uncharacterized protein n=1 Tax=Trichinella pseudospiralis TaxID=6337 RepID=A0A0V1K075_TRIPS|nr:hypothetical protein T4A_8406 [Trichinella pseudospiralis]KRZ25539.1 hypothetical protein T4B_6192 [Trichinella pseudospiralis]KRZ40659.1 hypothetical protein T4C_11846 [Trichinella pseudospiralis]
MLTTVGTVQYCAREEKHQQQQQQQHVFLFVDLKNHCKPAGAEMPALLYTTARLAVLLFVVFGTSVVGQWSGNDE